MCSPCAATQGCGYCLSSLSCLAGSADGPLPGLNQQCPEWLTAPDTCPSELAGVPERQARAASLVLLDAPHVRQPLPNLPPRPSLRLRIVAVAPMCEEQVACDGCAALSDCGWCGSQGKCLNVAELFSADCRGTVFDPPCPTNFVQGESTATASRGPVAPLRPHRDG